MHGKDAFKIHAIVRTRFENKLEHLKQIDDANVETMFTLQWTQMVYTYFKIEWAQNLSTTNELQCNGLTILRYSLFLFELERLIKRSQLKFITKFIKLRYPKWMNLKYFHKKWKFSINRMPNCIYSNSVQTKCFSNRNKRRFNMQKRYCHHLLLSARVIFNAFWG